MGKERGREGTRAEGTGDGGGKKRGRTRGCFFCAFEEEKDGKEDVYTHPSPPPHTHNTHIHTYIHTYTHTQT